MFDFVHAPSFLRAQAATFGSGREHVEEDGRATGGDCGARVSAGLEKLDEEDDVRF